MKLTFLFNQLLDNNFSSGGDVKSKKVYDFAFQDKAFETEVICPFYSKKEFKKSSSLFLTGTTFLEKIIFNKHKVFTFLVAYFLRGLETLKFRKKISNTVLYTTGDFICNTLPAFFLKSKERKVFWVACIYHINPNPLQRSSNYLGRSIVSFLLQRVSFFLIKNKADIIFVLNREVKNSLKKRGFKNKIVVSGAGINSDKVKSIVKSFPKSKKNQLSFFGRVNPTKGIYDLPSILKIVQKRYPKMKLHIFGGVDQSTKKNLKNKFQEEKILRDVIIHGFVEDKREIYKAIAESQTFISPSYEEGWGITVFEAILCGTIPIVYNLPIYEEIFKGELPTAKTGDPRDFAKEVVNVIESEDQGKTLDKLTKVVRKYTWKRVYEIEKTKLQKIAPQTEE